MDILELLAWVVFCLAVLRFDAKHNPSAARWRKIDTSYYALALIGIVLLFAAEFHERTEVRLQDAAQDSRLSLHTAQRYQPVFDADDTHEESVAEGFFDLLETRERAADCLTLLDRSGECRAAEEKAREIDRSLDGVGEPPPNPTRLAAERYAQQYCEGVDRLVANLATSPDAHLAVRRQTQLEVAAVRKAPSMQVDTYQLSQARSAIQDASRGQPGPRKGGARRDDDNRHAAQESEFGVQVLNAAAACPYLFPDDPFTAAKEQSWVLDFARHSSAVSGATTKIDRIERKALGLPNYDSVLPLKNFAGFIWPFILSLAVSMKFVRATWWKDPESNR